jgi:hypothetical protein
MKILIIGAAQGNVAGFILRKLESSKFLRQTQLLTT